MANKQNGITYYKLHSDYEGDYTKNCGLLAEEIDGNFFFLRGYDIKSASFDKETMDLTLTRVSGEEIKINLGVDFVGYEFEYDDILGVLTIKPPVGEDIKIEGFLSRIYHNQSMGGKGTLERPLYVSSIAQTGTFKPALELLDLTKEGDDKLPTKNAKNDRYVTKETINKFGRLYPLNGMQEIQKRLEEISSEWRIPTKDDWDATLNLIECPEDRNHGDKDSNRYLGKKAGNLLKSMDYWNETFDKVEEGCGDYKLNDDGEFVKVEEGEKGDYDKVLHSSDSYGFKIYPTGFGGRRGVSSIGGYKDWSAFWSNTEEDTNKDMFVKVFDSAEDAVEQNTWGRDCYLSIRLVKNFNGENFNDTEIIDGHTCTCIHLENKETGEGSKLIWTKENISFSNSQYGGVESPEWKEIKDEIEETRYFVNDWNGLGWDKHELHEGESIVLFESPEDPESRMHEWRLIDGVLVDTVQAIKDEFKETLEEIKKEIEDLNERLNKEIEDRYKADLAEADARYQADLAEAEARTEAINIEAAERKKQDDYLGELINTERSERINAINIEAAERKRQDDYLGELINTERSERIEAINNEAEVRHKADLDEANARIEAINNEANARYQADLAEAEARTEAINIEAAERKKQDDYLGELIKAERDERIEEVKRLDKRIDDEEDIREQTDADLQRQINENKVVNDGEDTSLVIVPGKTVEGETTNTTIKVNIPTDKEGELPNHIRVDKDGLYFDGNFGTF